MIINLPMKDTPLTFKFYSVCPQIPDRNAIIDDLESWLLYSNSLVTTISSTNPFELSMTQFKLNGSDSNAFIVSAQIQYMSVTWNTKYHAYYWVKKISRSSNDVITLDIELDFLNTLHNGDDELGSPLYNFHATSSIERQHENRFFETSLIDEAGYKVISYHVDKIKEGVQANTYRQANQDTLIAPNGHDELTLLVDSTCWYLIYVTDPARLEPTIFLMPERRQIDNRIRMIKEVSSSAIMEIDSIDRTNSNIIKIIKLPYCPVEFSEYEQGGNTFRRFANFTNEQPSVNIFKQEGSMENNILRFIGDTLENPFIRTLNPSNYYGIDYSNKLFAHTNSLDNLLSESRYIYDPKMESSEFKTDIIVYDSYSLQYKAENYEYESNPAMAFTYVQSADCDSSLIFRLFNSQYISEESYANIIASTRKNEIPTYSSDYINYMRNGYNYDRTKQVMSNIVNLAGAGASLVGSVATANPVGVVGSAMGLTKAISGAVSGELDFEKNMNSLKNKAMNVENVNDSSLFNYYANSRPKRVIMSMSLNDRQRWNDIFHYYGYNRSGVMGVPNVTSRVWFNFLKGEIVLGTANFIPLWLYEKVKAKYREGVTYYHSQMVNGYKAWDLTQEKENYETFLLDL